MNKSIFIAGLILISSGLLAQSTGDTIVVKSLHHGSNTRDTMVNFPDMPSVTFEKILMKYNMRCKDGLVSTGTNRNLGCGEWDYSCNTYITDSSKTDSLLTSQVSHTISSFTGTTFNYTTNPVNNFYTNYQTYVRIDSIISELQPYVGHGSTGLKNVLALNKTSGKSQYLYTSSEMIAGGVTAGNIDGVMLNVISSPSQANFLRVRIKATSDSVLSDINPDFTGFTEFYFYNTTLVGGLNRFQFHTPFAWNGTSNLIVEFSFTNSQAGNTIDIEGDSINETRGLYTAGDQYFYFNGSNYIESNQYKGIGGNNPRTIEAWIKTAEGNKEIVSWGQDAGSKKWNFRLNSDGALRVEINGGNKIGTTDLRDNKWHHVACTFSGNNVTSVEFYVDGVLDAMASQAGQTVNTELNNGIHMRISRGTNNRYFTGIIDEVRVWDTLLSATELQEWMFRPLDASHPKYSHLDVWYPLNEGSGLTVSDHSPHQNDASIINGNQWSKINGIDLFKEVTATNLRPNLTFLQGNYQLTNITDTILDTVVNFQHTVTSYQIFPKNGTQKSDSIASTQNMYWQAGYEYVIDTNGTKLDSFLITAQGTINITNLEYFRRYPSKFEIMSFVTPYGIGLDFGQEGHAWTFDLTDFSPVLKGNKRLTMEWGGQWQEEMDIQFLFIVGTPPSDILDIEQIWKVSKPSYNSISQDLAFEPRSFKLNAAGKSFKIRSAITGHGQEGEFIQRTHSLTLNNGAPSFSWQVWKKCADNPIYPQGGTWIYDRAGWCPGAATDLKETDITASVSPGNWFNIDYSVVTATGATNYIVNHQLVTYGSPNHSLDAAVTDIITPSAAIEYNRINYICDDPTIVIRNTGSTTLTSLKIEYWINDATSREIYSWTGSLDFMEEEVVVLPSPRRLWLSLNPTNNRFKVEVSAPNSGSDEYQHNNMMSSAMEIPDVMPTDFVIVFKTNNAPNENEYRLLDSDGNVLFERTVMTSNTEYTDTFNLTNGCYQYVVDDSGEDGIDFWNNNDGKGYSRFMSTEHKFLKLFEADFGKSIVYNFTVGAPLSYEELDHIIHGYFNVYPNPTENQFTVEVDNLKDKSVTVYNSSGQRMELPVEMMNDKMIFNTHGLARGIYFIQVQSDSALDSKKLIVQ